MKKVLFTLLCLAGIWATEVAKAAEFSYVWSTEFPSYASQTPKSDFTTSDGQFRFTSDKASGTSGPVFDKDNKAGLLLKLYAGNTLRIESLKGAKVTAITFVIGGNGHYNLAELSPSAGAMGTPYLGKDPTNSFKEYKLFWTGETQDITFTVGQYCKYGSDCVDQGHTDNPGTCMTKQIILTATTSTAIDEIHNAKCESVKILRDGHLLILRDGQEFNVLGQSVR